MAELFFLRHGARSDHSGDAPLTPASTPFDPPLSVAAVGQIDKAAKEIANFSRVDAKRIYVHFLPYLRCCQTADLLVTALAAHLGARVHLLGDFALSEWIHDNMKNAPPFVDSTEAYQMYTPNVRSLKNKSKVSNFRPMTTLGPYNEPGISYKEYANRCKSYFKRLVATYDLPSHANDVVIVVAHGYVINNFLSYFTSHPIFEEIPEAEVNYARKDNGRWILEHDCLGLAEGLSDATLNLENDLVYYKTNFVRKDEVQETPIPKEPTLAVPQSDQPRPSFKIKSDSNKSLNKNPLCPGAVHWSPQEANKFQIKAEFKMKVMNDAAFKRAFDITRAPTNPVSPEISPNSEPTRNNLRVDLLKLLSNEDIQRPLKLKYSLASDIPVLYLNYKASSHVSLAQLQRNAYSTENSLLDLLQSGISAMAGAQGGHLSAMSGLTSPRELLDAEGVSLGEVAGRLGRIRSLQRKRAPTPLFGKIDEKELSESDEESSHKFSLSFGPEPPKVLLPPQRKPSFKLIPTLVSQPKENMFYQFASGSSGEDSASDEEDKRYVWFGQNMSKG